MDNNMTKQAHDTSIHNILSQLLEDGFRTANETAFRMEVDKRSEKRKHQIWFSIQEGSG